MVAEVAGPLPAKAPEVPVPAAAVTPILESDSLGLGPAFGGLAHGLGDIAVRIAVEIAGGKPMHQQIAQRRSRPRMIEPQVIHVDIDLTGGTTRHGERRSRTCTALASYC